jgi:hypothetical protein
LEYHFVSSRDKTDVDVYCISSYLKAAIIGGNENKQTLSMEEQKCLYAFDGGAILKK